MQVKEAKKFTFVNLWTIKEDPKKKRKARGRKGGAGVGEKKKKIK